MGKLLGFLRVITKTECSKSANAESETDGILPPRLGGGVRLGDRGLIALAAYH
jgi:hypothetical protein